MGTIFCSCVSAGRSVRWTELSRKGFAVGAIHYGQSGKTSKSIRDWTAAVHHWFLRTIPRTWNPEIIYQRRRAERIGNMEKEVFWEKRGVMSNSKIICKGMPYFGASFFVAVMFCSIGVRRISRRANWNRGRSALNGVKGCEIWAPLWPPFFGGKLYRRMGWYIATPSSKMSLFIKAHQTPPP